MPNYEQTKKELVEDSVDKIKNMQKRLSVLTKMEELYLEELEEINQAISSKEHAMIVYEKSNFIQKMMGFFKNKKLQQSLNAQYFAKKNSEYKVEQIRKKMEEAEEIFEQLKKEVEIGHAEEKEKRDITGRKKLPQKTSYKISTSMGEIEIKSIEQIWARIQSKKKNSAIKGIYTIDYSVNRKR